MVIWDLHFLCSGMAAFLGTISTMSVQINKATPTWPPSPNDHCRSCHCPAMLPLNQFKQREDPAARRETLTPHPSTTISIITPFIHTTILSAFPLAMKHLCPLMQTSTMPTCPHFSLSPMGGSRSVCWGLNICPPPKMVLQRTLTVKEPMTSLRSHTLQGQWTTDIRHVASMRMEKCWWTWHWFWSAPLLSDFTPEMLYKLLSYTKYSFWHVTWYSLNPLKSLWYFLLISS